MATLSKAGQLFFVSTCLMAGPLEMYARLRTEILPQSPYQHRLTDMSGAFSKVIQAAKSLQQEPFKRETNVMESNFLDYIALVESVAAVWGAGERLYQLRRIAEGVNQPTFVYEGYLYLVSHILELYMNILRGPIISRSMYRDIYEDFRRKSDDCIEKLADAIFLTLTDDKTLPNWAHHKLSKETYPLALDWQRNVNELVAMPIG